MLQFFVEKKIFNGAMDNAIARKTEMVSLSRKILI